MESKCACGRSIRHRGRCMARRHPRIGLISGEGGIVGPVPIMVDPLGRAISIPLTSVEIEACGKCGGPKGRSPYAVCHGCMGNESMKAEAGTVSRIPADAFFAKHHGGTPSLG